jgi:hypothetical protein
MGKRVLFALSVPLLCAVLVGCGKDSKNADPKPAPGTKEDPRLQPASTGQPGAAQPAPPAGGSKTGGAVSVP